MPLASFGTSLALAWRSLRRVPLFTLSTTLTLALGVGVATAIFSVVNAVLLRPLSYPASDRLVGFGHLAPGVKLGEVGQSIGTYLTYQRLATSFEGIGMWQEASLSVADPSGSREPERLRAASVTPSVLRLLAVPPRAGRLFTEEEGHPRGARVLMISEELWQRRFGGDPTIVGRSVQVGGSTAEVVGIMPRSFHFPDARTQAWSPLQIDPTVTEAGGFNWAGLARLKQGVNIARARSELTQLLPRVPDYFPTLAPGMPMKNILESAQLTPTVRGLRDDVIGGFASVLWVVTGTAALVLIVAGANAASLLLVRAEGRQKELVVRTALGAGSGRIVAALLSESVLLAVFAAALGVALATVGVSLFVRLGPPDVPRLAEVAVDATALGFGAAIAILAAVLATLVPIWRQGRVPLGAVLRDGGRSATVGKPRQRARGALVAVQVAMAVVLLAGAGLLSRSVLHLKEVRPGFDANQRLTFRIELAGGSYRTAAEAARFERQLLERLAALPGVQGVGATSRLPLLAAGMNRNPISRADQPQRSDEIPTLATFVRASDGYFRTMAIPVVAGRTFTSMTESQSPLEVVVGREVARELWGDSTGASVVGQRVRMLTGTEYSVVGVVETVRDSALSAPPGMQVYFPIVPAADTGADADIVSLRSVSIVLRTSGDPLALAPTVRAVVGELDRTLPVFNLQAMDDVLAESYARLTFILIVLAIAASCALILGAVGLYGVVAYLVSLRTREIGVRIALGASPARIGRSVTVQGVSLAAVGVVAGLAVFVAASRLLRGFVYGVAPSDPLTLVTVTTVLVAVAALASWVPARRAARTDPVEAMRGE